MMRGQKAGFRHSPESREKMKGKRDLSPESRAEISIRFKGKSLSPDTCEKMSRSRMGHAVSEETRARISAAHKANPTAPRYAKEISAGHQRRRLAQSKDIGPLIQSGLTFAQIGEKLGLNQDTVSEICRDFGIQKPTESAEHRRDRVRVLRLAAKKRYREAHPEKVAGQLRKWHKANREHCNEKSAEWNRKNADRRRSISCSYSARRRAILASAPSDSRPAIREYFHKVKIAVRMKCYWCKSPVAMADRQIDHIIPVAKGGGTILSNLCCSCSSCNQSKSAQMPEDFNGQAEMYFA